MCITSGPAILSKTKILSCKVEGGKHLLAYSNSVENKSITPNSMILAIPGTLSEEDFYDTTLYKDFLNEIEEANKTVMKSLSRSLSSSSFSFTSFKNGMYQVLLSETIEGIGEALQSLPIEERPIIKEDLLSFFGSHYKKHSFVICVFSSTETISAQPIMFTYTPFDYEIVYFPSMDSHTGDAPNIKEMVEVDHFLITNKNVGKKLEFESTVPDILKNLFFHCFEFKGNKKNGDWFLVKNQLIR
ncbi:MAG: hypothetical protein ABIP51_18515 [Bacteroidia bacterium]